MEKNVELLKELENPVLELSDRVCALFSRKRQFEIECLASDFNRIIDSMSIDNIGDCVREFQDVYWIHYHHVDGLIQILEPFVDEDEKLQVIYESHIRLQDCMKFWVKKFSEKMEIVR